MDLRNNLGALIRRNMLQNKMEDKVLRLPKRTAA